MGILSSMYRKKKKEFLMLPCKHVPSTSFIIWKLLQQPFDWSPQFGPCPPLIYLSIAPRVILLNIRVRFDWSWAQNSPVISHLSHRNSCLYNGLQGLHVWLQTTSLISVTSLLHSSHTVLLGFLKHKRQSIASRILLCYFLCSHSLPGPGSLPDL